MCRNMYSYICFYKLIAIQFSGLITRIHLETFKSTFCKPLNISVIYIQVWSIVNIHNSLLLIKYLIQYSSLKEAFHYSNCHECRSLAFLIFETLVDSRVLGLCGHSVSMCCMNESYLANSRFSVNNEWAWAFLYKPSFLLYPNKLSIFHKYAKLKFYKSFFHSKF